MDGGGGGGEEDARGGGDVDVRGSNGRYKDLTADKIIPDIYFCIIGVVQSFSGDAVSCPY